jgi:hypothetical protein
MICSLVSLSNFCQKKGLNRVHFNPNRIPHTVLSAGHTRNVKKIMSITNSQLSKLSKYALFFHLRYCRSFINGLTYWNFGKNFMSPESESSGYHASDVTMWKIPVLEMLADAAEMGTVLHMWAAVFRIRHILVRMRMQIPDPYLDADPDLGAVP